MRIDRNKRFELKSPYFAKMREDLDAHISRAFNIMNDKNMSGAKIGLVIDIATSREKFKDENDPTEYREAIVPRVDYKLTFKLEAKSENKEVVIGAGNEVVRDSIGDYYIIPHEEANGQMSMFNGYADTDDEFPEEDD